MKRYIAKEIEPKWRREWDKTNLFKTDINPDKPKKYILDMFPYPSGEGLHMGHMKIYSSSDIVARYNRHLGFNVLHPMGWDAFGLPAENYAIKTGIHPEVTTKKNIDNIRRQMMDMGYSYDWSREFATTDPDYYKWTQWIFLKLFERGLAYEDEAPINWCPKDKTGLANEEVVNGHCERCGAAVERKVIRQWILKITEYAERLLNDVKDLDWPDSIKDMQINWIGKSEGTLIKFTIEEKNYEIEAYTTRIDTVSGVTALVIAPEHPRVSELTTAEHKESVGNYLDHIKGKSDLERTELNKEKTGVFTGSYALNPVNGDKVPVWIADYVLGFYGTGCVMVVPAHDARDYEFVKKYNLPVKVVIEPVTGRAQDNEVPRKSIVAIVRNPKTKDLLSINWGTELGGNLFIGGGVEAGEDIVQAAIREVKEETGYQNLKLIDQSETVHHHYYASAKKIARLIEAKILYFDLVDETRGEVKLEPDEVGKFTVEWISEAEAGSKIRDELHKYGFDKFIKDQVYEEYGILTNSGQFDGLTSDEAKKAITDWLKKENKGDYQTNYKLRDWVFSRQRYWGEPIPLIHCDLCGIVAVPDSDLPVTLPQVTQYEPTGTGESPLATIDEWVNVKCPKCGGEAKRETNTMPQWAGSCWYYLRFCDPKNSESAISNSADKYWMAVDWYLGGAEHAVLHLLYARFWHKVLFDLGVVKDSEPFTKLSGVGLVLAADGTKMSKSKGNVVNPDDVVGEWGADTTRTYIAFMGPFDMSIAWDPTSINGVYKFLSRFWEVMHNPEAEELDNDIEVKLNKTILKVGKGIEQLKLNTSVASMMELINSCYHKGLTKPQKERLLVLLAPFAPYMAEELWSELGHEGSIHTQKWPEVNQSVLESEDVTIVVQVNGKVRANITVSASDKDNQTLIEAQALQHERVIRFTNGQNPKKVIFIPGKILNIII